MIEGSFLIEEEPVTSHMRCTGGLTGSSDCRGISCNVRSP
jgi:hypothetical protein